MRKFLLIIAGLILSLGVASADDAVKSTLFEGIKISGVNAGSAFNIELINSTDTKAVLEVSPAIKDMVQVNISSKGIITATGPAEITQGQTLNLAVYAPAFTELALSGNAVLKNNETSLTSKNIKIRISGNSSIEEIELTAGKIDFKSADKSTAAFSVTADNTSIEVGGSSEVRMLLKGCEAATIYVKDSGVLTLRGVAMHTDLKASSKGVFHGFEFSSGIADCRTTGEARVEMDVIDELNAQAIQTSSIKFSGNPRNLKTDVKMGGVIQNVVF